MTSVEYPVGKPRYRALRFMATAMKGIAWLVAAEAVIAIIAVFAANSLLFGGVERAALAAAVILLHGVLFLTFLAGSEIIRVIIDNEEDIRTSNKLLREIGETLHRVERALERPE